MEKILQEGGLDPEYWLEHFKNIGAITLDALKLCGPDEFNEISKFVRRPLEEKVLRKFLGLPDEKLCTNVSSILHSFALCISDNRLLTRVKHT